VVTFEVAGGKPAAFRFANALSLIDISNNLGDAKSLLTHPETTTHMKLTQAARDAQGVTSGLMRLSVGLEDAEDLCEDLGQALKAI
jgi:O-succinylhomoserine sulfhydrylase